MLFHLHRILGKLNTGSLQILDRVLSAFLLAPAVVGYWRGTWILSDLYLFPGNYDFSMVSSLLLGFFGQIIFTCSQDSLADNLNPSKNGIVYYVLSRTYTYVFGIVCINLWRGIWKALDLFSGQDVIKVIIPTLASLVFLVASKILRNISASPFLVALDLAEGYFAVPTMFKLTRSKFNSLYVLDVLFSVFVVGCLVVFAWRGVWCIFDIYLYPNDESLSALASLISGYVVVFIVFTLEKPIENSCDKLNGIFRLVLLDIYILISFVGTINLWRGIWNLLNIYFLPESPALSCWITHFGCFLFLALINCSNSLLVRGVLVDGEESGGKCVIFTVSYLKTLLAHESSEKKESGHQEETIKDKQVVIL